MGYDGEISRLTTMIDELRRMRESCEPKNKENSRYHAFSMAVSSLNRVIDDMRKEEAP